MFVKYDLLAQGWVPYSEVDPFSETFAGIAMTANALLWLAAPVATIIGEIGATSVIKAVLSPTRAEMRRRGRQQQRAARLYLVD
ncbi:hypothetical protein [Sulfitobacter sp. F26169L]|uniref:hypothetical protein n=1 Tax=Sulfitobacter sp. F26169L TaxID=2996015 RepID=UPI003A4C5B92